MGISEIEDGTTATDSAKSKQRQTKDGAPVAPESAIKGVSQTWERSGKRVLVTIHNGTDELGKQPVFISLNGDALLVRRNVTVSIPEEHYNLLKSLKQTVYDEQGNPGDAPRYAYTFHGPDDGSFINPDE